MPVNSVSQCYGADTQHTCTTFTHLNNMEHVSSPQWLTRGGRGGGLLLGARRAQKEHVYREGNPLGPSSAASSAVKLPSPPKKRRKGKNERQKWGPFSANPMSNGPLKAQRWGSPLESIPLTAMLILTRCSCTTRGAGTLLLNDQPQARRRLVTT